MSTKYAFGYKFGHPFRAASSGRATDQPFPWPVTIGGMGFVVEIAHYSRTPPDPFRQAQDNGQAPGEGSLNPEGSWKRNRADWTLGAGQLFADDDGAFGYKSQERRFLSSKGVDALGTRRQLSLLHDVAEAFTSAAAGLQVLTCGAYAYLLDGSHLRYTTDPYAASPSFTAVDIVANHSSNATSDGATIWVANGVGVRSTVAGSGTSAYMGNQAATFAADHLGFVNGWIIGAKNGRVAEISADGHMAQVGQLDYTHPSVGWKWVGIIGTPNGIYVGGSVGDYGAIYFIGVDSAGALTAPALATELARGETVTSLAYYGGRVFVGTSRGFHIAETLASDGLAMGPLITTNQAVLCADGQGESVYFGWSNYDGISSGIGRARLDEFYVPDVPGYCSDLMAGTAAVPVQGNVASVCTFKSKRLFTVDGVGLFAQAATFVAQAMINFGAFTFGVFEPKAFASVEVVTDPLAGTVNVAVIDSAGQSRSLGSLTQQGGTGAGLPFSTGGVTGEQVSLVLTLSANQAATAGPVVRRFTMRAMPTPAMVEQWTLPVILTESVKVGPDDTIPDQLQDVQSKLAFLYGLVASQRAVIFQWGQNTRRVVVRNVSLPEGFARGWTTDRTEMAGIYAVQLVSEDIGS